jgi:hypothetical protein
LTPIFASYVSTPRCIGSELIIDLSTLAGLHRHQHQLAAYCPLCDRWAQLDLAAMVSAGLGDRRLPIKVRCSVCAGRGRLQVRPPVPTRSPVGGWMESPR